MLRNENEEELDFFEPSHDGQDTDHTEYAQDTEDAAKKDTDGGFIVALSLGLIGLILVVGLVGLALKVIFSSSSTRRTFQRQPPNRQT